ncbi:hypothetical protein PG993_003905 [Apiospora rasikravindrae]|uniref:2EXR domain-containing protein n=1 Tax=Apiospora rasikravindrae TaxID=990691 RepID=A0ABR1U356_9PEZI
MAQITEFHQFCRLPKEIQLAIWEQAILSDNKDRIVPVAYDTKRIVLTYEMQSPSAIFEVCHLSRVAVTALYDTLIPMVAFYMHFPDTSDPHRNPFIPEVDDELSEKEITNDQHIVGYVRVSTELDIFLVSAWHYTFHRSGNLCTQKYMTLRLAPELLSQMERLMEQSVDKFYDHLRPGYNPNRGHQFDGNVFTAAREYYHVIEHSHSSQCTLVGQLCSDSTSQEVLQYYTQEKSGTRRSLTRSKLRWRKLRMRTKGDGKFFWGEEER